MEYDLPQGLHDLAQTPPVGPLAPDDVITRVRRGRALRTTAVTLASAAVVVGAAVLVNAAPWDAAPIPPATPTPAPTGDHTPEPTPTPTPEPTQEPRPNATLDAAAEPPIVALTPAGDMLVLDPHSGATLRVHEAVADAWLGPGWVSTDQTDAYVVRDDAVHRVDLADGRIELVAQGYAPAVSPDGRLLAYIGPDESGDGSADTLWLLDQEHGTRHSLNTIAETELELPMPSWARDGATLYLSYGLTPDILAIPVTASGAPVAGGVTTLRAPRGEDGYPSEFWSLARGLPDGDLVHVSAPMAYDNAASLISVRRVDGSTRAAAVIEDLSGVEIVDLAAAPQGGALVAVVATRTGDDLHYSLVRWDSRDGISPLADDVRAVAW